jgi:hypothetical protein
MCLLSSSRPASRSIESSNNATKKAAEESAALVFVLGISAVALPLTTATAHIAEEVELDAGYISLARTGVAVEKRDFAIHVFVE